MADRVADGRVEAFAGRTMGTSWSVRLVAAPGRDTRDVLPAVTRELDAVIDAMSGWEPNSALCRFNRAPPGSWHPLEPGFFTVLAAALAEAEASDGAFDPTLGALVDLWGFGAARGAPGVPSDAAIEGALARTGWRRIAIDRAARRVRQPGGVALDLSGIAKGHAVDRVADRLGALGYRHCLVEIGGELVGRGVKPDGTPWWVDVPAPPGSGLPPTRVALHDCAIATSGDDRRVFTVDGRDYGHSLDPRTGRPLTHGCRAVTVVADRCITADARATALLVLGVDAGCAHAAARDIAALFHDVGDCERTAPVLDQLAAD